MGKHQVGQKAESEGKAGAQNLTVVAAAGMGEAGLGVQSLNTSGRLWQVR